MNYYQIIPKNLWGFREYLERSGNSRGTVDKYTRDIRRLAEWLGTRPVSLDVVLRWKETLLEQGCGYTTINSMLAAANSFFRYMGWEIRAKFLRVQKKTFRDPSKELTQREYFRLLETAEKLGQKRLFLLMETICATGIRVSEVPYITVEAAKCGKAEIALKGKVRTILLPQRLCQLLLRYAQKQKIVSGEIFLTRNGRNLSRKQIWAEMKALCQKAGISAGKVFPHNLRHLFARTFYKNSRDIVKLSDILGHSSIETTRIYLQSAGTEHIRLMEQLHLLL